MKDLEKRLAKQGIDTVFKYKGQTKEKQGISFQIGKDCFKGSKIDRKFSLGNLEKYFAFRQQQKQKRFPLPQYNPQANNMSIQEDKPGVVTEIGQEISKLVTEILKPEPDYDLKNAEEYENLSGKKDAGRRKKTSLSPNNPITHFYSKAEKYKSWKKHSRNLLLKRSGKWKSRSASCLAA